MNIYYLERTDEIGYDEYDSFVVVAKSSQEVIKVIKKDIVVTMEDLKSITCELVGVYIGNETEPFVLCSSFNAA